MKSYFKNFDRAYLIAVFPLLRMSWAWLSYRCNVVFIIPFICAWFWVILSRARRCNPRIRSRLFLLSVAAVIFFAIYHGGLPFLYGIRDPMDRLSFHLRTFLSGVTQEIFIFSVIYESVLYRKFTELKFLVYVVLFVMMWTGVAGYLGGAELANVGSGRLQMALYQGGNFDDYQVGVMAGLGMGTSGWIYTTALSIPLLILVMFKTHGVLNRAMVLCAAIAGLMTIRYGGLTTPMLILAVGVVMAGILIVVRSKMVLLAIGFIFAGLIVVFSYNPKAYSFLSDPVRNCANLFEDSPQFKYRFESMADALSGGYDSYAAVRYERQQISLNKFIKGNWLVGIAADTHQYSFSNGGHSELLDCLATYGLTGFFVIGMFYIFLWRFYRAVSLTGLNCEAFFALYVSLWVFSSIPNPIFLGDPVIVLLVTGLPLFIVNSGNRRSSEGYGN